MADDRDLERRLERMYGSARPRADFEDELWHRIQARRPWPRKLADLLRPAQRLAPVLAALLVLVIGGGWLAAHVHLGGSPSTLSSTGSSAGGGTSSAGPGFGVLPAPPGAAKSISLAPATAGANAQPAEQAVAPPYSFVGKLPQLPATLPVYRYREPTAAARTAAAGKLASESGLRVDVQAGRPATSQEPQFVVRGVEAQLSLPTLEETAEAFVTAHRLTPGYLFQVTVAQAGQSVVYARQFQVNGASVPVARPAGQVAGLSVEVDGNLVVGAHGPLELPLDVAEYPVRPAAEALGQAGAAAAQLPATGSGLLLDKAQVVYVVVVGAAQGYYEPALLLTGSGGTVLVPLISANWLSH